MLFSLVFLLLCDWFKCEISKVSGGRFGLSSLMLLEQH